MKADGWGLDDKRQPLLPEDKFRLLDSPGIMNGTLAGCFAFVGAANGWCNRGSRRTHKCQSAFLKNGALPILNQEI